MTAAFELVKGANLLGRFVLELCALGGLAYWGFHLAGGLPLRLAAGSGAPLAAVVWGCFVAPKAPVIVPRPVHLALQIAVFGAAAAGLASAGRTTLGLVLAVAALVNSLLMIVWRQLPARPPAQPGFSPVSGR